MTINTYPGHKITEKPGEYKEALELAEAGKTEEALTCIQEYLASAPNDAEALNDTGAILFSLGYREDAVNHFTKAKELYQEQQTSLFSDMSDNRDTYTGQLKLDLTTGQIEECHEILITEWIIVDPNPKNIEQPDALKMTAVQSYSIEKIK